MSRITKFAPWLVCLALPSVATAIESASPPILEPGRIRAIAAAGPAKLDRQTTWDLEASFEVGLAENLEIAAPLALGIRLIDAWPGSALYLGVGIVDLFITPDSRVLYSPSFSLAGHARFGHESSLHAAFDLTGVEEGLARGDHPLWLRGSLAIVIDFGPWATLAAGFAYQRIAMNGDHPAGTHRTGWVSDSRFSVGAVRAQPFYDIPTLSVHVTRCLDILMIARVDIDHELATTDQRWLFGVGLKN